MGYDETRTIRSDPCDRVTYWTDWIRSPGPCVPIPLREGWVVYYLAVSNFRISPNISEQKSAGSGVNRNDGGVAASCHLARRHVFRQFNTNSRGLHLRKRDVYNRRIGISVFTSMWRLGGDSSLLVWHGESGAPFLQAQLSCRGSISPAPPTSFTRSPLVWGARSLSTL